MWKALFASKNKPVIGIAWTGGTWKSGKKFKSCGLEDFKPLFDRIDAHYVSLQYKPSAAEAKAFGVAEYKYATLTDDYDDTAAMVAALDAVVTVPTAVAHLAGALGVPTFALNAKVKCWKYNAGNPFHPSNNVSWKGSWPETIESAVPEIKECCASSSASIPANQLPTTSSSTPSLETVVNLLPSLPSSSSPSRLNGEG